MKEVTQKILDALAAYRKQAAEWICPSFDVVINNRLCQPPVEFEKTCGLAGISQHYILPEGLTSADLQTYALLLGQTETGQRLEKLTEVWDALVSCNPELKKISSSPRGAVSLYHRVMGVASAFNISDIQHFISSPGAKAQEMEKSPEFKKLTEVFNRYAAPEKLNLKWVAAPETLRLIQNKVISQNRCDF
jgi:hypothetical protein